MARKVTVYEAHSNSIAGHVKKSVAQVMCHRLVWSWIVQGRSAKILPLKQFPNALKSFRIAATPKTYIPETLPLAEVEGVKFVAPKNCPAHPELLTRAYLWARASAAGV